MCRVWVGILGRIMERATLVLANILDVNGLVEHQYLCFHQFQLSYHYTSRLSVRMIWLLSHYSVSWYQSVHFIGQMGLSVAGVNIGSCAVAVVSHHLFGEFTKLMCVLLLLLLSSVCSICCLSGGWYQLYFYHSNGIVSCWNHCWIL